MGGAATFQPYRAKSAFGVDLVVSCACTCAWVKPFHKFFGITSLYARDAELVCGAINGWTEGTSECEPYLQVKVVNSSSAALLTLPSLCCQYRCGTGQRDWAVDAQEAFA